MNRLVVLIALAAVACYPKAAQNDHSQLNTKSDSILAAIAADDAKIDALTTAVAALKTELDGVKSDIATLQSSTNGKLTTAQSSLDALSTAVASVDTQATGLASSVGDVASGITAIRQGVGWRMVYDYDGNSDTVNSGSIDDLQAAVLGGANVRAAIEVNTDVWFTVTCQTVYIDSSVTANDRVTCIAASTPDFSTEGNYLLPIDGAFAQYFVVSDGSYDADSWGDNGSNSWWDFSDYADSPYRVRWFVSWNAQP